MIEYSQKNMDGSQNTNRTIPTSERTRQKLILEISMTVIRQPKVVRKENYKFTGLYICTLAVGFIMIFICSHEPNSDSSSR